MEGIWQLISVEKIAELLNEVSRRFRLPLAIKSCEGGPLPDMYSGPETAVSSHSGLHDSFAGTREQPITYHGEVIGTISAATTEENLEAAAFCIENALRLEAENIDLSAEIVRIYEEQALIYSLSRKLGSEMEVDGICQHILDEADKLLVVNNIVILLHDPASDELYASLSKGRDREASARFRTDAMQGLLGEVFRYGEPMTICNVGDEDRRLFPYPVRSILCVPLVTDDRGIGMLVASDKLSGEEFWSRELKLMGVFALEAAAAIKKAQLYEEISSLFIQTVEALASSVDAKDPYTFGHSNRVARLTSAICEGLGMSRKEVRQVELAAILHDIGKIGTPESILQKPERLDPEEMSKIREHSAKGAQILSNIDELHDVIAWIRHHHEWYDGNGYPDGLSSDAIPLQARIIAVADAFDAMTSDRPYRKGMSDDVAVANMEECSGSQFDPQILMVFKSIVRSGILSHHLIPSCNQNEY
ncbi:MAG TPA: HD domain-containing phosphohydrolase [Geobacteraceae bacterium]|nr:HD domain-containing phosphohydrolase [Geobacteraceae bacterium]